jgi:chromosome segregation ATPase
MNKLLERLDINSLIASANNSVYCGEECRKKKKEVELREKMNKAALNAKNAPEEYEKAQGEYIRFLHGDTKFNEYEHSLEKRRFYDKIKQQMTEIQYNSNELEDIKKNNKYLNHTINILENNMNDEDAKILQYEEKLDKIKKELNTTKQKTNYENDNQQLLNNVFKINNYLFYILLIISFIVYYFKFGLPTTKMIVIFIAIFIYGYIVDYYTIYF